MPTYEYQCNDCGRVSEVRQRITEPALTKCDACGGTLKRLLSAAPFILKGEGWYVTDYPSESRKKAVASEKSGGDSSSKDSAASGKDSAASKDSGNSDKGSSDKSSSTSSSSSTSTGASAPTSSKPSSKPSSSD